MKVRLSFRDLPVKREEGYHYGDRILVDRVEIPIGKMYRMVYEFTRLKSFRVFAEEGYLSYYARPKQTIKLVTAKAGETLAEFVVEKRHYFFEDFLRGYIPNNQSMYCDCMVWKHVTERSSELIWEYPDYDYSSYPPPANLFEETLRQFVDWIQRNRKNIEIECDPAEIKEMFRERWIDHAREVVEYLEEKWDEINNRRCYYVRPHNALFATAMALVNELEEGSKYNDEILSLLDRTLDMMEDLLNRRIELDGRYDYAGDLYALWYVLHRRRDLAGKQCERFERMLENAYSKMEKLYDESYSILGRDKVKTLKGYLNLYEIYRLGAWFKRHGLNSEDYEIVNFHSTTANLDVDEYYGIFANYKKLEGVCKAFEKARKIIGDRDGVDVDKVRVRRYAPRGLIYYPASINSRHTFDDVQYLAKTGEGSRYEDEYGQPNPNVPFFRICKPTGVRREYGDMFVVRKDFLPEFRRLLNFITLNDEFFQRLDEVVDELNLMKVEEIKELHVFRDKDFRVQQGRYLRHGKHELLELEGKNWGSWGGGKYLFYNNGSGWCLLESKRLYMHIGDEKEAKWSGEDCSMETLIDILSKREVDRAEREYGQEKEEDAEMEM